MQPLDAEVVGRRSGDDAAQQPLRRVAAGRQEPGGPGQGPRTNLVDSPTPILAAIVSSLVRSTGPAIPSLIGSVTPRARTRRTQVASTLASKHRLLTM